MSVQLAQHIPGVQTHVYAIPQGGQLSLTLLGMSLLTLCSQSWLQEFDDQVAGTLLHSSYYLAATHIMCNGTIATASTSVTCLMCCRWGAFCWPAMQPTDSLQQGHLV